ncbi:hypothetical protein NDU88_005909 [Pleurodeles waltl]|uniref:Uncharacterized protein n=1 Tax=Pleurodeles waltl TaxID=8319 RepID=A0AAV7L5G0_PLEWA|nr:hypothetical protein NDU88_005909 [Pleurodeles waltl]
MDCAIPERPPELLMQTRDRDDRWESGNRPQRSHGVIRRTEESGLAAQPPTGVPLTLHLTLIPSPCTPPRLDPPQLVILLINEDALC